MNIKSIKFRILALSLICLFVTVASVFVLARYFDQKVNTFVGQQISGLLDAKSKESLQRLASTQAAIVQSQTDAAFLAARTMADAMTVIAADGPAGSPSASRRGQLNGILQNALASSPLFNGTYSAWEPNALDGNDEAFRGKTAQGSDQTGRALPYWTRDAQGKVGIQPLAEYDSADLHPNGLIKGGWYLGPRETLKESILAPLPYIVQGRAVFLATMSVPVKREGRFIGVLGADFDLAFMQKLAQSVNEHIYNGKGGVAVVTQAGLVVASSQNTDAIGKAYSSIANAALLNLDTIKTGTETVAYDDKRDEIRVYSPIKMGNTGAFWSLMVSVPRAVVMQDATNLDKAMAEQRDSASNWQIALALGIAAVAGVLMWLASLSVANPIVRLTSAMQSLADRKTGVVIPGLTRGDEIGAMARTVGVIQQNAENDARKTTEENMAQEARLAEERKAAMVKMADDFEAAVGGIVETVSRASGDLQGAASILQSAATTASERSATVAQASESASQNVNTVAAATEELANSVGEISVKMEESARMSANAVTQASGTAKTVHELAEAAQRIGEISDLISNVAGQTNLLALNATIEAARAGEAGRGFAVVAAEVKGLADQTARAASQISAQIGAVQHSTNSAVDAIGSISQTIEKMSEISAAIAAAVEEQSATTQDIARSVQRASSGTTDVTVNIGTITSAAVETSTAAGQVLGASNDLAKQSTALRTEVDRFLATVRKG